MQDVITVMKFTIKDMVTRKSFIISTLIILVMIVIGFNVPNIISSIKGEETETKILIVDSQNIFEGSLSLINSEDLNYEIQVGQNTFDEIKEKLENGDIDSAIIVEENENTIKMRYILENMSMMDSVPEDIITALNSLYTNVKISKLGLTEEQIKSITPNFEFEIESTGDEAQGNIFLMMFMSIALFYAIYFCAYQVSSSITTEKTSKIMETLVTSTSPKTIILGKTIGIGLVGLLQMVLLVITAYVCANAFLDKELLASVLDVSNLTIGFVLITFLYFILGYFTYAFLYALTGSTVSKPEDIQSANGPVAILAVIGFYLSYFTMLNPTSSLNAIASLLPISSPFCMPFRIMMGLANTWDIVISVLILFVTILLIAKIAIKIYSSAILNYGTKMNLKDIFKIYKDKNN
ncbi:MAG: ABC transporter permease [Clostridia bacterium]|nr:ABC transporter permease [Clostridia bacterium]